ncbi:hypothetical protein BJQ97_02739 [Geobacillus sp. TFV-3]|nr:hypothetical protein BJQ97_02739 [Geobacillus sp. TFV-3]
MPKHRLVLNHRLIRFDQLTKKTHLIHYIFTKRKLEGDKRFSLPYFIPLYTHFR